MRRSLVRTAAWVGGLSLGWSTALAPVAADGPTRGWAPPREARLPEGFPAPTEPGRVLVKWYPSVRGASVRVDGDFRLASYRAFWPLFRHIESAGVAMTAPVVSGYGDRVRSEDRGTMEMAFLYPSASAGRPGSDTPTGVRVFDADPVCVVSVGVEGSYDLASMRAAVASLDRWLEENAGTWRAAGAPRRLAYQQPLPFKRVYSEVQVPIEPRPIDPRVPARAGT
jgi:hypothetical protein